MIQQEEVYDFVARELAEVPDVECVLASREGDLWKFWSVVNDFEDALFDTIYDHEDRIRDHFKNVSFDFRTVMRRNRRLEEVIDPEEAVWLRSEPVSRAL